MTRYYAITMKSMDMAHVPENATEPYGRYEVVMASEAEAAIRELVDALRNMGSMQLNWDKECSYDMDDDYCYHHEYQGNCPIGEARALIAKYKEDA